MQLNAFLAALTEPSARPSSHARALQQPRNQVGPSSTGLKDEVELANSTFPRSAYIYPLPLHVQLLIDPPPPPLTPGDKPKTYRNRPRRQHILTIPTRLLQSPAHSHGPASGAGPTLPLQDRQDSGRGLILGGQGVRAHRYWSLLCRKGHQQAPHGRP
jgi:hypothetical protein